MSYISETFAEIFKKKQQKSRMTQTELGKIVGCDQTHISGMFNGKKPINDRMIEKLCAVLGLKITLTDLDNSNPEQAVIWFRCSAEAVPPELAKDQTNLAQLFRKNRPVYDSAVAVINHGLKTPKKTTSAQVHHKPPKKEEVEEAAVS